MILVGIFPMMGMCITIAISLLASNFNPPTRGGEWDRLFVTRVIRVQLAVSRGGREKEFFLKTTLSHNY